MTYVNTGEKNAFKTFKVQLVYLKALLAALLDETLSWKKCDFFVVDAVLSASFRLLKWACH